MAIDLTVCLVNFYAADAVALALESFQKFHPGTHYRLHVLDNGSADGAAEYLRERADVFLEGTNSVSHGESLTRLCETVETRYLLAMDNDLEFVGDALEEMYPAVQREGIYCACPPRPYGRRDEPFGQAVIFEGRPPMCCQWSPNICLGLMRTDVVRHLLQYVSFGHYINHHRNEFFEMGAMVYRAAAAAGWDIVELPSLWHKVRHWGGVSRLWAGIAEVDRPEIQARYEEMQHRLRLLRGTQ